jgi:endoglucanase
MGVNRRQFVQSAIALVGSYSLAADRPTPIEPTAAKLPRWRGFNLLDKCYGQHNRPFAEKDFGILAEWGFDFVRLPMSYRCWSSPDDLRTLREPVLKEIDEAIDFGKQYGIHVCLNFHRAPGYCVNPPAEPIDLWKDEKALEACAFQWGQFAERYRGVPNGRLSFNLLNEPAKIPESTYVRVVRRLVESIREHDPGRLIIADGLDWGRVPVYGLVDLKIAQSTRGYDPMQLTHYKANWVQGADRYPTPKWPLIPERGAKWDKDRLKKERIEPWKALEAKGVGIHIGEWGAHQFTPHSVALAWMRDMMALWQEAGWGWALWNLNGNFGVLDSGRSDVNYEEFRGHRLDREMLAALQTG